METIQAGSDQYECRTGEHALLLQCRARVEDMECNQACAADSVCPSPGLLRGHALARPVLQAIQEGEVNITARAWPPTLSIPPAPPMTLGDMHELGSCDARSPSGC